MKTRFALHFAVLALIVAFAGSAAANEHDSGKLRLKQIEKEAFPSITVHLGLVTTEKAVKFRVFENDREIKKIKVGSRASKQPVDITLLIDVSGSMEGEPLESAKEAAKVFIDKAASSDRIAIVTFSADVDRVAELTRDKDRLKAAIEDLEARGETAVYDALMVSLTAPVKNPNAGRTIILLSDGGDTDSSASEGEVLELSSQAKIPVSVITLQSEEFNPGPLVEIARRSNGHHLSAVSPDALLDLYDGLAAELHNRYQVAFKSLTKTGSADLRIEALVGREKLTATTRLEGLPRPKKTAPLPPKPKPLPKISGVVALTLAIILSFAAAVLAVIGLSGLFRPNSNTLAKQLKYYDQLKNRKSSDEAAPFWKRLHESSVETTKQLSNRFDFNTTAQAKLEQAGLPVNPNEYIVMHIGLVIGGSVLATLASGSLWLGIFVVVAAVLGPLLFVELLVSQRRSRFNNQLPDTLELIASSLRAGHGLQHALLTAGREGMEPTAEEFTKVANQIQLGMSLEEGLARMAKRLNNTAFNWFVLAVGIQKETGGNLSEIIDTLADSLRKREGMHRQIKALTAEGRLSAWILTVLPFLETGFLFYVNSEYMSLLLTTPLGLMMALAALLLITTGILWMAKLTRIDY